MNDPTRIAKLNPQRPKKRARQCQILAYVLTALSLCLYASGAGQAFRGEVLPMLILFTLGGSAQFQALVTARAGERWNVMRRG